MPMYRKKPIVVEARRLDAWDTVAQEALEDWCHGKLCGMKLSPALRVIKIETLEGEMTANAGDWIIKGVKGEFYPCRADIFDETYEEVHAFP